jgi:hypothetical protein
MRKCCCSLLATILLATSLVGCGSAGAPTSVAPEEGKMKSMDAAKPQSGAAASKGAAPSSKSAMPSYYDGNYPDGGGQQKN